MTRRRRKPSKTMRLLRKVLLGEAEALAPEAPASDAAADESLLFLSHAPGSLSEEERAEVERIRRQAKPPSDSKRVSLRSPTGDAPPPRRPRREARERPLRKPGALGGKKPAKPSGRSKPAKPSGRSKRPLTQRIAVGLKRSPSRTWQAAKKVVKSAGAVRNTAGKDALLRTWNAFRFEPPPRPTGPAPSFFLQLPGSFLRPFTVRGALATLVGALLICLAAAVLELTVVVGIFAVAGAAALIGSFRLHMVREVALGRDGVDWPDWDVSLSAFPVYAALLLLFAPAAVLGLAAWGPAAWDEQNPESISARVDRHTRPGRAEAQMIETAAQAGETYSEKLWTTDEAVREVRREQGIDVSNPESDAARERAQWAREELLRIADRNRAAPEAAATPAPTDPLGAGRATLGALQARSQQLFDPRGAGPLKIAAQVLFAGALFLFPMALLAASHLRSAYAALHLPLLLRSILRAPFAYTACVLVFVLQDVLLVIALALPEPVLVTLMPRGVAHGLTVALVGMLALALPLISGAALGRFYRCSKSNLRWE